MAGRVFKVEDGLTVDGLARLQANTSVGGNLTVDGNLTVLGNFLFTVRGNADFVPEFANLNLGSAAARWGVFARTLDVAEGATFRNDVVFKTSNTSGASFRVPHGIAPAAPVNGDHWTTAAGSFVRINGQTRQYAFADTGLIATSANNSSFLEGQNGAYYLGRANHTGTVPPAGLSGTYNITANNATFLNGQAASFYTDITSRLGYTPVRQGGGPAQLNNTLNVGWSSNRLRLSVDGVDKGFIVLDADLQSANVATTSVANNANFLSGQGPAFYLNRGNHTGVLPSNALSGSYAINITGSAATAAFANTATTATDANNVNFFAGQPGSYYLNSANHTGNIADARLPATMSGKTFSSAVSMSGALTVAGNLVSGPTDVGYLVVRPQAGVEGGEIRLAGTADLFIDNLSGNFRAYGANCIIFQVNNSGATINGFTVWHAANFNPNNYVTVGSSAGDAASLAGQNGAYYLNSSNQNAGILPTARLSGTYAINITGSAADSTNFAGQASAFYTNIPARLGYTPVQQGGGAGQGVNKVHIGWDNSIGRIKAQIDNVDQGPFVMAMHLPAASVAYATSAGTATSATTAGSATNATNATFATTAGNANAMGNQPPTFFTDIPARLGYTPVQQGGGLGGQATNKIYLGWSTGSRLKVTVDNTDLGGIVFDSNLGAASVNYASTAGTASSAATCTTAGNSQALGGIAPAGWLRANTGGWITDDTGRQRFFFELGTYTYINGPQAVELRAGLATAAVFNGSNSSVVGSWTVGNILQVNGVGNFSSTVNINGGLAVNGAIASNGDITAFNSSDIKLKKDLTKLTGALDKIRALSGYEYTRIETGAREVGIIAQEVESVLPLITKLRDDGILGVQYERLIPLLIEAIKELADRP